MSLNIVRNGQVQLVAGTNHVLVDMELIDGSKHPVSSQAVRAGLQEFHDKAQEQLDNTINAIGDELVDFVSNNVSFNEDGSIMEELSYGTKLTEFQSDGSIIETLTYNNGVSMKKKTIFNEDGTINVEVIK